MQYPACGSVTFEASRDHTVQERLYLFYKEDGSYDEDDNECWETTHLSDFTHITCAECECAMPLPETSRPFSVLLLWPLSMTSEPIATSWEWVDATTPTEAVALARAHVLGALDPHYEDDPADFMVLLVVEGHHDDKKQEVAEPTRTVSCKFCHAEVPSITAHMHQGRWVGDDCCWDERLRTSA